MLASVSTMLECVQIGKTAASGRYRDVIEVCEFLGHTYGSPTNALAVMARDSKIFKDAWAKMARNGKAATDKQQPS